MYTYHNNFVIIKLGDDIMDLKIINENNQFIYRVSALIYNQDLTKILLFQVENREWYMLPGGKVQMHETSTDAIKREIKEELGFNEIHFDLIAISEEFNCSRGFNNHQIDLIYKGIYKGQITNNEFKGLDGDWACYKWIDINKINNYKIHPTTDIISNIIESNNIKHFITKEGN